MAIPLTTRTWLKLPGMQNSPLIYDRSTGHVYTFSDLKCVDSKLFKMKIHSPVCNYFIRRVDPARSCTAKCSWNVGHFKGHGPPGRLEMEMFAFWWQVIIYILAKYRGKAGSEVIELVYNEWPFTMKQAFRPTKMSMIMHSTLEKYQKLALADAHTQLGLRRFHFLKSHNQFSLDVFKEELKKSTEWWGSYDPVGTPALCCILTQISMDRGLEVTDFPLETSSKGGEQGDANSLAGMKRMLEVARLKAEEKEREAEQLRRALAYLNYSIVSGNSELSEERIDEIIKIGEMAEMDGLETGYLIRSMDTYLTDESNLPVA